MIDFVQFRAGASSSKIIIATGHTIIKIGLFEDLILQRSSIIIVIFRTVVDMALFEHEMRGELL